MAKENPDKIYLIGSKTGGEESVLLYDKNRMSLMAFERFEHVKASFKNVYDLLLAPGFTPAQPPGDEELNYHMEFMRLVSFYPVIVGLNKNTAINELMKWRVGAMYFETRDKFFDFDYWHMPMKPGFLQQFGVLDIVKDIEEAPFIGPNGKMVLRLSKINYSSPNNPDDKTPEPLSKNEIDEMLRKRGYL